MRIDLIRRPLKRRRGEIGMEAMLILPAAIVVILLARLIMEGMLIRQEVSVYTRAATASAAQAESALPQYCTADHDAFAARPASVTQTGTVFCRNRDAEQGLTTQRPFWDAVRQGAQPWRRILRDIEVDEEVKDMQGDGTGTTAFTGPAFLAQVGVMSTSAAALYPQQYLWTHEDEPLRSSYDPVIWDALREQGTWQLFPEVFPARDN